jgi:ABC-type antimicrobial peptide transport system permease subunit
MIACSVNQRTRESGLRIAVGARRSDVLIMVIKEGLPLTAGGIILRCIYFVGLEPSHGGPVVWH